ncbi:MAG: hypothetical protein HOE90_10285 [Bacteriovoracaceae bacterium]|jgi:hypothetical protein|nr:hypothetical protein [Bacteriovoracaceae bacterium]
MNSKDLTDETLLSFIQGELSAEYSKKIESMLENSSELRLRVSEITTIYSEIQTASVKSFSKLGGHSRSFYLLPRVAFVAVVFCMGIFTGTKLDLFQNSEFSAEVTSEKVSSPLGWDESQFLSLM